MVIQRKHCGKAPGCIASPYAECVGNFRMTQAIPAPRGERVASPDELVVVTRRKLYEWLDRLSAGGTAAEDKLLGCVPDEKAAEDELLGCVPDDRLIAELRRRGYQTIDRKILDHQEAALAKAPGAARRVRKAARPLRWTRKMRRVAKVEPCPATPGVRPGVSTSPSLQTSLKFQVELN
jgi:hypothetical protein